MSELKQFKLPDVGEGLTEAEIVKWHVQPGDPVTVNQIIVEIETAKAVVELPSPLCGRRVRPAGARRHHRRRRDADHRRGGRRGGRQRAGGSAGQPSRGEPGGSRLRDRATREA